MSQIYKLTDTRNGMEYIGQHNGNNKNYFTGGTIAWNIRKKFGKSIFKREIIVEGNFNQLLLDELERHYIRLYATKAPLGYNLTDGGRDGQSSGHAHTEESRGKISKAHKGKKKSKIHRERLSLARKGKSFPNSHSKTIYTFVHRDGLIENCTQQELKKKYNLKNVSAVVIGAVKSIEGWYLNDVKETKKKYYFDISIVSNEYKSGLSCTDLSKKYNVPGEIIAKRLKKSGIEIRRNVFANEKNRIGILKCDSKDNGVLKKYDSVNDATRDVGATRFLITKAIKNNTVLCGFKWQYA